MAIVFLLTTGVVFGLRAIPSATTPTAKADVCSWPVINLACDVITGTVDGVKLIVNKTTGVVRDAVTKKVVAVVSKAGCVAGAKSATDGLGAGVLAGICAKVTDWLGNHLLNTSGPTSSGASPPGSPPPTTNGNGNGNGSSGSGNGSNSSQDGTPASALSTAPMAALAAVATIFVADHISSDTQANVTGGWFQPIYAGIEGYAWLLAVIAVAMGTMYVMVSARAGELAMLLGRVPWAALLMVGVPVMAMLGMQIIDLMCGDLMKAFPDAIHMLHITAGVLGVLGGTSVIASLLGHATIAHLTGTAAWFIGAFGLLASGAIALELIAREIAIYLTVLIVPLALVGEIFSPFARWATALIKVLFVVIISKLLLAIGLIVAGTMMIVGIKSISPIMIIVGLVALLLISLFPAMIYGALIRIESAWHTGMSRQVVSAPSMTMANHLKTTHTRVQAALRPTPSPGSNNGNGPNGRGPKNQPPNRPPPDPAAPKEEPPLSPVPEPV